MEVMLAGIVDLTDSERWVRNLIRADRRRGLHSDPQGLFQENRSAYDTAVEALRGETARCTAGRCPSDDFFFLLTHVAGSDCVPDVKHDHLEFALAQLCFP